MNLINDYAIKNSEAFPKIIDSIEYSVMNMRDIINMSEVPLVRRDYYDQQNKPAIGGPLDLRMGSSIKNSDKCLTCDKEFMDCFGHFGYIKLVLPIYHIGFFQQVVKILQCICKGCGKVLIEERKKEEFKIKMSRAMQKKNYIARNQIYKKFSQECEKKRKSVCEHCGFINGNLKKMPQMVATIMYENEEKCVKLFREVREKCDPNQDFVKKLSNQYGASEGKQSTLCEYFSPLQALEIFKQIEKSDVLLFNMDPQVSLPEDLIITHILAPPCCIRPTVQQGESQVRHDDLTCQIKDFLDRNNQLQESIIDGEDMSKINQEWYYLQCSYAHYLEAGTTNMPWKQMSQKNGGRTSEQKDIRALAQRLQGKKGRFRGNLSGKRSNFTGRTVISPDPNIQIDQVVVPEFMAKILTFPEIVNEKNKNWLQKLVLNGPDKYPGALYLIKPDTGLRYDLKYIYNRRKDAEDLQIGDIVQRHIQNGEVVLFNRQPSLHRISIMAFKILIQKWHTLRFNECCCQPFNADFDGDQMNIHVPQTLEARAEALELMDVKKNLISPKNGETIIALVQDFLTAGYLVTHQDMFFDRAQFCQIMCYFSDANEKIDMPPPTVLIPVQLWTGQQVYSAILRPNQFSKTLVNFSIVQKNFYTPKTEFMCPQDGYVIFKDSELLSGNLGKTTLGAGSKQGLFYRLIRDNSCDLAAQVMTRCAKFSGRWLSHYGMTIGISDVTPSPQLYRQNEIDKDETIEMVISEASKFVEESQDEDPKIKSERKAKLEGIISGKLNEVRNSIGTRCNDRLPPTNGPLIMAKCGSKGNNTNLSQMIGCVGQQMISNKRVPNGFTGRTLPHFEKDAEFPHPEAIGFVRNSFFTGLTPPEFFFHTMAGRESLVDSAIKTADTGYMSRRLVQLLEDLAISYDFTVRSCDNSNIVQFRYGGDGMCPWISEQECGGDGTNALNFDIILSNSKTILQFDPKKQKALSPFEILSGVITELRNQKLEYIPQLGLSKIINQKSIQEQIQSPSELPVGLFAESLLKSKNTDSLIPKSSIKEPFDYFKDEILQFFLEKGKQIKDVRLKLGLPECSSEKESMDMVEENQKTTSVLELRASNLFHITQRQLKQFFLIVWQRYFQLLTEPGEAVGAIGATSISEPATQMTLKSFHFAGVASMNITQGVPRMKEIIDATKKIKAPIISIKMRPQFKHDEKVCRALRLKIEPTKLGEITLRYREIYSPKSCFLLLQLDKDRLTRYSRELGVHITLNHVINGILNIPKIDIKPSQLEKVKVSEFEQPYMLKILPYAGEGSSQNQKLSKRESEQLSQNLFFQIQHWKRTLPNTHVFGLDSVDKVSISQKEVKDNQYEYSIKVKGLQSQVLREIFGFDEIDYTETNTVDINEVLNTLGVEAARRTIIEELKGALKMYGLSVDRRHIVLVADIITSKGKLFGSTRQSIPYIKDSTLMQASFEKTTEILYNAAILGRTDNMQGVSERIIIGRPIPMGSGSFSVLWGDFNSFKNSSKSLIKSSMKKIGTLIK